VGLVAACGGEPVPAPTTSLPAGAEVSPREYLADSAYGAAAVRRFVAVLDGLGPSLTAAEARGAVPGLRDAAEDARLAWGRLSAARLEDTRLERQRRRVVPPLQRAVLAMESITTSAGLGRPSEVVAETAALRAALEELAAAG
jgi:hypothetical protein